MSDFADKKTAAIEILTKRFSKDELSMEEYERLVSDIQNADSERELSVVADIASGSGGYIDQGDIQTNVAILSERRLSGSWLTKRSVAGITFLASQVFDFRNVHLPAGVTTIELFTIFGAVEIIVPPTLAVRMEVSPLAGEAKLNRGVKTEEETGKAVLLVCGNAIFGSIIVKVKE